MPVTQDQLTINERRQLQGHLSLGANVFGCVLLFVTCYLIAVLTKHVFYRFTGSLWVWYGAYAVGVTALAWWTGKNALPAYRERIKQELKHGIVQVCTFNVQRAYLFEEREDEGPSFAIETTDQHFYVFSRQAMVSHHLKGFPWAVFAVRKSLHAQIRLSLRKEASANRVTPIKSHMDSLDLDTLLKTLIPKNHLRTAGLWVEIDAGTFNKITAGPS